jgi:hypothetical protein
MSRGRQITPEERERLLAQGPEVFETHGVINHERAVFARTIGEHVVGSDSPHFASMQPRVKVRDVQAWRDAYSFVLSFLKSYQAHQTAETVDMEFTRSGITSKPEILEDECPGTPEEFDSLLHWLPDSDDDFQARVSHYSEIGLAARPLGDTSGSAFLTQPVRAPVGDGEEDYGYEEDDAPRLAESGVQPDLPASGLPSGSPRGDSSRIGLGSEADLDFDFEIDDAPVAKPRDPSSNSDSGLDIHLNGFEDE